MRIPRSSTPSAAARPAHGRLGAEHREVRDAAGQQLVGGAQDPVVVALGQDDVPARGPRALEERVLEHQRRRSCRAVEPDAAQHRVAVHVLLHQPQGGRDLAIPRDGPAHGGGRRGCGVGVGVDRDHRDAGATQPVDEPRDGRRGWPAGQQQARHGGVITRQVRGQGADHDVRPVGGSDHQIPVGDALQEPRQAHGPDDEPGDLADRRAALVHHVGAEGDRHLGDGRCCEQRHLRQHGGGQVADHVGQPGRDVRGCAGIHPVGDHADQRAAPGGEDGEILADGVEDLGGRAASPTDDEEHRAAEVVGRVDVEVELDGQRRPV